MQWGGGVCPGESLPRGGVCPGQYVEGVSAKGVPVLRGVYHTPFPMQTLPQRPLKLAVRILLECVLVYFYIFGSLAGHFLYLDTRQGAVGDTGRLSLHVQPQPGPSCLTLYYNMLSNGSLAVSTKQADCIWINR